MKQIKVYVGVLFLVIGLMVMPVLAGQVVTNSYNVAYEALGAAQNLSIGNPQIVLGNTLPNGSLVNLNLSGAANFVPNQTYYLCANNSVGPLQVFGSGATTTSSLPIVGDRVTSLGVNLVSTNSIYLYGDIDCSLNATFRYPAQSGVGSTTLSGNVGYYGTQTDTFAGNTITTINNQITTSLSTADLIQIDYLSGAANGTTVVSVTGATNLMAMSANKLLVMNNTSAVLGWPIANTAAAGAFNQVLTLSDSQGWTGIRNAYLTNSSTSCAASGAVAAAVNAPTSGNMTLNYANVTSVTTSASITVCINVAGNVILPSRVITGSYSYVVAGTTTGLIAPAGGSATTWQTWLPNGYQAFNPYMYVGTANSHENDVFVRLYNNSVYNAHVYCDVYPADGTASQRLTLADIAPNTAGLYWAADIGAAANLAPGTSFAAQFTVTAPKDQVNGVSFMKRTGGERQMPLYKSVNGASNYLTE